jgi:tetratricopeptide (TPR) repeat protein
MTVLDALGELKTPLLMLLVAGCAAGEFDVKPVYSINGAPLPPVAADPYVAGRAQVAAGRYGLGIEQLSLALRQEPDRVDVLNALGVAYDQIGRTDVSQRFFHKALALDPASPATLNNLARSAMRQGKWTAALQYLRRASDLAVADPVIQGNMQVTLDNLQERHVRADAAVASDAVGEPWPRIERTTLSTQSLVTRPQTAQPAAGALTLTPAVRAVAAPAAAADPVVDARTGPSATVVVDMPSPAPAPAPAADTPPAPAVVAPQLPPLPAATQSVPSDAPPLVVAAVHEDAASAPAPAADTSDVRAVASTVAASAAAAPVEDGSSAAALVVAAATLPVLDATAQAPGTGEVSLRILNGAGRRHMAARMRAYLADDGFGPVEIGNARLFRYRTTIVRYRPGMEAEARRLCDLLPGPISLRVSETQSTDLLLRLGRDLLGFDRAHAVRDKAV